MKWLAFDLEIANVFTLQEGEDLLDYAPFFIGVAATMTSGGERKIWHSLPARHMTREDCQKLLEYLWGRMYNGGYNLVTWNGAAFDLRWLAWNADTLYHYNLARQLAWQHFDPMFQIVAQRGFGLKLATAAQALGIAQEKTMSGADAPRMWAEGMARQVIEYVQGDVEITAKVWQRLQAQRRLVWPTDDGVWHRIDFRELLRVFEACKLPHPNTGWMDKPITRRDLLNWALPAPAEGEF